MSADGKAFAWLYPNPAVSRAAPIVVASFALHMRINAHDLAEVSFIGTDDVNWDLWTTGTPLMIAYGRGADTDTFFGYVLDVDRSWSPGDHQSVSMRRMRVSAVGASWPLKNGIAQIWQGATAPQVATAIAATWQLGVDAPSSAMDYQWASLAAPGVSAWSFLVDLARQVGAICSCHGTQLRFYAPLTVLGRGFAVPTFYEADSGATQTVVSFRTNLSAGSSDPTRRLRIRQVHSIDADVGTAVFSTDAGNPPGQLAAVAVAPSLLEFSTDLVVDHQSDAMSLLPALGVENQFFYRASAEITGEVAVTQGTPIVVEGLGARDSGMWQVLEVVHRIHPGRTYRMTVELGRDSDYDTGWRPTTAANVWYPGGQATAPPAAMTPPSVLFNGQWRAAYSTAGVPGAS